MKYSVTADFGGRCRKEGAGKRSSECAFNDVLSDGRVRMPEMNAGKRSMQWETDTHNINGDTEGKTVHVSC